MGQQEGPGTFLRGSQGKEGCTLGERPGLKEVARDKRQFLMPLVLWLLPTSFLIPGCEQQ